MPENGQLSRVCPVCDAPMPPEWGKVCDACEELIGCRDDDTDSFPFMFGRAVGRFARRCEAIDAAMDVFHCLKPHNVDQFRRALRSLDKLTGLALRGIR